MDKCSLHCHLLPFFNFTARSAPIFICWRILLISKKIRNTRTVDWFIYLFNCKMQSKCSVSTFGIQLNVNFVISMLNCRDVKLKNHMVKGYNYLWHIYVYHMNLLVRNVHERTQNQNKICEHANQMISRNFQFSYAFIPDMENNFWK